MTVRQVFEAYLKQEYTGISMDSRFAYLHSIPPSVQKLIENDPYGTKTRKAIRQDGIDADILRVGDALHKNSVLTGVPPRPDSELIPEAEAYFDMRDRLCVCFFCERIVKRSDAVLIRSEWPMRWRCSACEEKRNRRKIGRPRKDTRKHFSMQINAVLWERIRLDAFQRRISKCDLVNQILSSHYGVDWNKKEEPVDGEK